MKRLVTMIVLGLMLALPAAALAEDDDPAPGDFPGKGAMKKFRAMRIAELQEVLNLDEKTTIKLNGVLKKHDDDKDKLMLDVRAAMRELRGLMEAQKPDDAKITAVIDKLAAGREKIHDIQAAQIKEVRKVLTPVQQAKFVLHMAKFKKHMREMIRKSWRHGGAGPGPGGPGPGMGPGPHAGMGLGMGPGPGGPGGPDMPPPPPEDDDEF